MEQSEPHPSYDIFAMTSPQWIEAMVLQNGGKGACQAAHLYNAILKKGLGVSKKTASPCEYAFELFNIKESISSFSNADHLWKKMSDTLLLGCSSLMTIEKQLTEGNTTKLLFRAADGYEIESVVIPMKNKETLCISSQVGCRMACAFCETGRMGLLRNLTVSEIVQQVFITRHVLGIPIKNIVFMGMGEPFDNYESVIQSAKVLMDANGLGFGRKNITISTSGRVHEIRRFTQDSSHLPMPNLAISLNGASNGLRTFLMPHNRKDSLEKLFEAVSEYITVTQKDVLFAYVLLKGINDSVAHADEVASYLLPLQKHIRLNVIPYNPQSHDKFQPPSDEVIDQFIERVRFHGLRVLIRRTKGRSIMAGCGQLGNVALRESSKKQSSILPIIS